MFSFFFFVCTCYSHTKAYKIELLWTRIDVYCQNLIVLVVRSGYKINLHFRKTSTKNENFKSIWQQKVLWLRGIDAIAPSNIPRSETTARIPHLSSEWSKFVGKQARLRFLETRPDTRLPQSHAGGQGPYLRSPEHLGRSGKAKMLKNAKKVKCDGRTDGPTDRPTDRPTDGPTKRGVESRARD